MELTTTKFTLTYSNLFIFESLFCPKSFLKTHFKPFVICSQTIFPVVPNTRSSTDIFFVSVPCLYFGACHHTFLFLHMPRHCRMHGINTPDCYMFLGSIHVTVICQSTGLNSEKYILWRSWHSLKQTIIIRCINKWLTWLNKLHFYRW